jgi:large subunit ribosomal protein L22
MIQYMQNFDKTEELDMENLEKEVKTKAAPKKSASSKAAVKKEVPSAKKSDSAEAGDKKASSKKSETKASKTVKSVAKDSSVKDDQPKDAVGSKKVKSKINLGNLDPCGSAILRGVFISPRKANDVVKLIRGKKSDAALSILKRCPRIAATHIHNLLHSAVANSGYAADSYVMEAIVGRGPCAKRVEFKGRGRTGTRSKFMCYIRVVLGVQGVNSGTKS